MKINVWKLSVALTIIFTVLKLTKAIDWSWVWVVSPLWITIILTFVVFVVIFVVAIVQMVKGKQL